VLGVDRRALVGECRVAGDHEHPVDTRQVGRQIIDETVCKIPLLRIVTEIGERQHNDRHARHLGRPTGSSGAVGSSHRRYKPIASRRNGLDAASFCSPLIEYAAKRRDLDGQIGVLDHGPPPNGGHDLLFRNERAGPLDKHGKNVEGSRTDRYRDEHPAFIAPGKPLPPPIETKVLEQENVGRGDHADASRLAREPLCAELPLCSRPDLAANGEDLQHFCKFFRPPL
jgi:hypothetical protein